jgi:hypothetical protein
MKVNFKKSMFSIFALVSATVFLFQNCAGQRSPDSILVDLNNANQVNQDHVDDTPAEIPSLISSSLLMNRKVMYSLFVDIYGPAANQIVPLQKLKVDKAVFGSPCSVYDNFRSAQAGYNIDAEADSCANSAEASQLSARVEPSGNTLQEALINDICVRATENVTVSAYIMSQIKESPTVVLPANSDVNILKLIALFYRGKPAPHLALIQSLRAVIGNPGTADGWKNAFLTVCTSVHWQAL